MKRVRTAGATGILLALVLCGCGGDRVAQDPGPSAEPRPSVAPGPTPTPTATPSTTPGPGSYPAFAPSNYTYTLSVGCFCADGGAPIEITVVDGEVTSAVYAGTGRGVEQGDRAPEFRELTINDVIEAANDTDVASVDVTWPEGQAYPSEVSIDQIARAIDDEITYAISEVVED